MSHSPNRTSRRRRGVLSLALVAALAALLAGCGASDDDGGASAGGGSSSGGKSFSIGYLTNQSVYFYQEVGDALSAAAAQDGGKVITVNTNNDASAELKDVQDLISRGVKAIVMGPISPTSSLAGVKQANQAGIPVICYNTCLSPEDSRANVKAYIEADNADLGSETGRYAADYIRRELGGRAQVALLNCDEFDICRQRKAGFKEALRGLDVDFVADQTGYASDTAAKVTQDILTAHPDVDAIWTVNDGATSGARAAVKAKTGDDRVVVFGTDINPQIAGYLLTSDDILQATTGQDGRAIGTRAYAAVRSAMAGDPVTPFTQLVPGSFFSRSDPDAVRQYLARAKG
ncbi:substrate-binding domain-containing protein [Conexibacter sp. CPCC 206217]|uniref:substrate-binding domain-containing protein n=1 Tax=Conexibacter sp. CPCC 206217 TaxID=3064574 RepID=UPI002722C61C|nr:substrate-binding domain-containing protein [Conexibacter sp. CPCC 206217]MDO8209635.1 substrate-binding domain-containing protein [Conexibacter sp. CPCC 206217]